MRHRVSIENNTDTSQVMDQIIKSAFYLFSEQGYHNTTVRQISRSSNILLSNVYNYFPSKDAIYQVVLEKYHPWLAFLGDFACQFQDERGISNSDFLTFVNIWWKQNPGGLRLHLVEILEFQGQHIPMIYKKMTEKIAPIVLANKLEPKDIDHSVERWSVYAIAVFYISLLDQCIKLLDREKPLQEIELDHDDFIRLIRFKNSAAGYQNDSGGGSQLKRDVG